MPLILPTVGDNDSTNNHAIETFPVVSSFDPNEKQSTHQIPSPQNQDWLTYTIHFQNTERLSLTMFL